MKHLIKNFLLLTIPSLLLVLILFELIFRFVIPAANKPDLYFDRQEKMIRFNTQTNTSGVGAAGRFSQQRGHWTVNNFGWNSPYAYQTQKDNKQRIAVIGDSFIESLIVDNTKTYPFLIAQDFNNTKEVYAFGISGAPMSQYLHMSRYVSKNFNPDVMVVNIVYNDFDESLASFKNNVYFEKLKIDKNNQVTELEPKPFRIGFIKEIMKRSALMRYLYINLKFRYVWADWFKPKETKTFNANVSVDPIYQKRDTIKTAVDYIFSKLRTENPDKKILLVMDGPRLDIYAGKLQSSNVLFLNKMVAHLAAKNNLDFIDLTNVFERDYEKNHREFNSEYDSHWNIYGHQIVADTVYHFIKDHYIAPLNKSAFN